MTRPKDDPDPKAIACYGILRADTQEVRVRFVEGRPVSPVTTAFLTGVCERLRADGKQALLRVWDNARWHLSKEVRGWIRTHNRQAKRAVVEPAGLLSKAELIRRICSYFNCQYVEHLQQVIAKKGRVKLH